MSSVDLSSEQQALALQKALDFEQKLAEEFLPDYPELEMTEAFKSLHAVLVGLWRLLDEHGTYPYLMKVLPI